MLMNLFAKFRALFRRKNLETDMAGRVVRHLGEVDADLTKKIGYPAALLLGARRPALRRGGHGGSLSSTNRLDGL